MEPNNIQPLPKNTEPIVSTLTGVDNQQNNNTSSSLQNPLQQPSPALVSSNTLFSGRLNRIGYFLAFVYMIVICLIPLIILLVFRNTTIGNVLAFILGIPTLALLITVSISTQVRRWHDMNLSGFLILLSFVPFLDIIITIIYLFVPGTKVSNKYGEPDTRSSSISKVLFGK